MNAPGYWHITGNFLYFRYNKGTSYLYLLQLPQRGPTGEIGFKVKEPKAAFYPKQPWAEMGKGKVDLKVQIASALRPIAPPPIDHKRSKSVVFFLTKQLILGNFL